MRIIRAFLYKIGLRPKRGSIFYSPSRELTLAAEEGLREIEKVWTKTLQYQYLSKKPTTYEEVVDDIFRDWENR